MYPSSFFVALVVVPSWCRPIIIIARWTTASFIFSRYITTTTTITTVIDNYDGTGTIFRTRHFSITNPVFFCFSTKSIYCTVFKLRFTSCVFLLYSIWHHIHSGHHCKRHNSIQRWLTLSCGMVDRRKSISRRR